MDEHRSQSQRPLLTQEQLKKKLEVSNFTLNAILRGAQLTVVGGRHVRNTSQELLLIMESKLFEPCRIRACSHQSIISKLLWPLQPELQYELPWAYR